MKRFLQMRGLQNFNWFVIAFLSFSFYTKADPPFKLKIMEEECDTCSGGSSAGGISFGTLSSKDYIGIGYFNQLYGAKEGLFDTSPTITESYNTLQIQASKRVNEKIGVSITVPYQLHTRDFESTTKDQHVSGLGDVSVFGFYQLVKNEKNARQTLRKQDEQLHDVKHEVNLGAGLKLPTGTFQETLSTRLNPGLQSGTGSLDFVTMLGYNFSFDNVGFTSTVNYFLKTKNQNEYKFGNQLSYGMISYIKLGKKNLYIPFIGFNGEYYQNNEQFEEKVIPKVGGNVLYSRLGLEYSTEQISVGSSASIPISQSFDLNHFESKSRLNIFVNYLL